MSDINAANIRKNRITLVLLLAVFVVGIFGASLLVYFDWHPSKTKNHGELITPARDVPDFVLQDSKGNPFTKNQLARKWSVIYVAMNTCEAPCQQTLYNIRQARLAQAANVDKVQYLYLQADITPEPALIQDHPDMIVVKGAPNERNKLLAVLTQDPATSVAASKQVYLVDPLGRVMMKYADDFEPKGLVKDLELLLKLR
jgi:cytochrome oxidase Cu insertion factor (SCO1/SenC/PrrC family)